MSKAKKPRWTSAEESSLRKMWEMAIPMKQIAETLARRQSAVFDKARRIGLPVGCPPRWEYISRAAERTGYDIDTVRRALRHFYATMQPTMSRPPPLAARPRSFTRTMVSIQEVDAAIENWMKLETVAAAARRLGMTFGRLARLLRAAGVHRVTEAGQPRKGARGGGWMVSDEDIAAAMAQEKREASTPTGRSARRRAHPVNWHVAA